MKDIVKEINKITNQPYVLELSKAKIISAEGNYYAYFFNIEIDMDEEEGILSFDSDHITNKDIIENLNDEFNDEMTENSSVVPIGVLGFPENINVEEMDSIDEYMESIFNEGNFDYLMYNAKTGIIKLRSHGNEFESFSALKNKLKKLEVNF